MSWDTFLRLWRWGNAISLLGVLQFVGCLTLAMLQYAGGSPLDRDAAGYSFHGNYLSDLGRSMAWSGAANDRAAALFNTSLVVLAVAQVPFFLFLPLHAPDRILVLSVAAILGLGSCAGLAGVGLTPYDLHLSAHLMSLMGWIAPLLVALVIHALAIFTSDECSPLFALLSLGLAALIAYYAIRTAAFGLPPHAGTDTAGLVKSIVLQKYVLFACVAWYFVLSVRMLLLVRPPVTTDEANLDDMANRYLQRLQRVK